MAASASVVCIYLLLCGWVWPYTMDDAFISFRYAKHIGDGIGPVWNLLDRAQPIEGFTSFLHVWLLGGIRFVSGGDVELAGKGLGVLAGLLLLGFVALEIRKYQLHGFVALVALSFMALPFTALNAVSGMETTLFMLWNWLCAMACVRLLEVPTKRGVWLFVSWGLLGTLTRPEFGAAFLLMALYVWWKQPLSRVALLLALFLVYLLPGVAVTAWRYSFYGDWVPNPFYVKQSKGFSFYGAIYVARFLGFVALPYLIFAFIAGRAFWIKYRNLLIVVALNVGIACAYFTTTKPLMGLWFRFLIPQISLLAFCAALALKERGTPLSHPFRFGHIAAVILLLLVNLAYVPVVTRFLVFSKAHLDRYGEVGRRLRPFAAEDRWLIYVDVGKIVYESEWNTVDIVGLNTHRTKLKSHCEMRTDVVLRFSGSEKAPSNPCSGLYYPLVDLPFTSQEPRWRHSHMRVFARNDITYAEELQASLADNWPGEFSRPADWLAHYAAFGRSLGPLLSVSPDIP